MVYDEVQSLYDSVDEYKFYIGSNPRFGHRKCTCTLSYDHTYGGLLLHWTLRQRTPTRVRYYTQWLRRVYRKPSSTGELAGLAGFLLPDLVNIVADYLAGYILENDSSDNNLVQEVVNGFRQLSVHSKKK